MNALANPEVGRFINENFVSSFQKVATFQIVNGQKQGGNVAAYFCAPDGRVLHVVAGPVGADQMLREARWVVDSVKKSLAESNGDGSRFKMNFRRWHSQRLRDEHGLIVEPVVFDQPLVAADENSPLAYRDPAGRQIAPILPPPPIEGPDVTFRKMAEMGAADKASAAPALRDRRGNAQALGNQGRVHMLMAAHCMMPIEKVYGTVFENILGEKISTRPVIITGNHRETCLHCASKRAMLNPAE